MILTSEFSLQNARICLEASDWVYGHGCELVSDLCHAHVSEVDATFPAIDPTDNSLWQMANGTARVLAFRGTASVPDWITDAQFRRTEIGAGQEVHHGFLDAILSLNEDLKALAKAEKQRPMGEYMPPLFITGHSLGGAMALLAAELLAEAGCYIQAVYTFGGPRVGNGAWAKSYDAFLDRRLRDRTWRVVNEEDIVPRLPGSLIGYRHAGHEVFLPADTHVLEMGAPGAVSRIAPDYILDPPLWRKAVSDLVGTWQDLRQGRCAQLADHYVVAYAARLGDREMEATWQ